PTATIASGTPTTTTPMAEPPVAGMAIPPAMATPDSLSSTCTSLAGAGYDGSTFDQVREVYTFGDSLTTACLDASLNRVCLYGVAAEAGADYENWGAGFGLQLANDVVPVEPFDAT